MTDDKKNASGGIDFRKADAAYRPFPSFVDWSSGTHLNTPGLDRYRSLLQEAQGAGEDVLGTVMGTAGVDDEYQIVDLKIDNASR